MVNDIIINGIAQAGKDTFIEQFRQSNPDAYIFNLSSIDPFRKMPEAFGWKGGKDNNYRMCLHLLKQASKYINNYPTRDLLSRRNTAIASNESEKKDLYIFYHIREPNEIEELLIKLPEAITLIIRGDERIENACPPSDIGVLEYEYDLQVFNRFNLENLRKEAELFKRRINDFQLYGDEDYR